MRADDRDGVLVEGFAAAPIPGGSAFIAMAYHPAESVADALRHGGPVGEYFMRGIALEKMGRSDESLAADRAAALAPAGRDEVAGERVAERLERGRAWAPTATAR